MIVNTTQFSQRLWYEEREAARTGRATLTHPEEPGKPDSRFAFM